MWIALPEIPEAEHTPLVRPSLEIIRLQQERTRRLEDQVRLQRERIQQLEDEIARLKARPRIAPNSLEAPPRPPRDPHAKSNDPAPPSVPRPPD